ncbi:MAG: DUF4303 domain-containing protein [Planctomycetales bacterium]|nr:DUF4303 domain-containing protein [Planctomycetales bacterium]
MASCCPNDPTKESLVSSEIVPDFYILLTVQLADATQKMNSHEQLQVWLDSDAPELEAAVVADIQRIVRGLQSSGDTFYGYAVLPGDYITQPNPASHVVAFNRESDLAVSHSEEPYYRYCVCEWQNYVHNGFNDSNSILESQLRTFKERHSRAEGSYQLDEHEIAYVAKINRAILVALVALKQNGSFDDGTYMIIWYSDSDAEIMNQSAKTLNSARITKIILPSSHSRSRFPLIPND